MEECPACEEECPVCDGTGFLLSNTCPLCEDFGSQSSESPSPLCLVLDIDGTLLSEGTPEDATGAEMRRFLRPHLHKFLDFAFDQFGAVGIWTAASQSWLQKF